MPLRRVQGKINLYLYLKEDIFTSKFINTEYDYVPNIVNKIFS
jgi:hypothetical protein